MTNILNRYIFHTVNQAGSQTAIRQWMSALLLILSALTTSAQTTVKIGGNLFGGGESGKVGANSHVTINTIDIDGNIYGGGNRGDLDGSTQVVLRGGDFKGGVFGGARMANVGKSAFVNIDGAGQLHDITANAIYGGNDIAGNIGGKLTGEELLPFVPEVNAEGTVIDNSWQSYILATPEKNSSLHIFVGQMFNAGNGDYNYADALNGENQWEVRDTKTDAVLGLWDADSKPGKPVVGKSYMQVNGGTYGYVFGGGNAATVTEQTVISINNSSTVTHATDALDLTQLTDIASLDHDHLDNPVDLRLLSMGINLYTFVNDRQFINIFGGNNQADMAIRPMWNLHAGSVHNLYGGGNEGRMTSSEGLLTEIKEGSTLLADNVYGGCRKADVRPLYHSGEHAGEDVPNSLIKLNPNPLKIPDGFSARLRVLGGNVTNVYGGNDISGDVYGGNTVGIYTTIHGNVYGGGNGSYAYTDNPLLKDDIIWGDFYYNPDEILAKAGVSATSSKLKSVEALNIHRPNAEQVSIRVHGTALKPTVIEGALYIGGNSATLETVTAIEHPKIELKIGSYTWADKMFLGNNGESMVDTSPNGVLSLYAGTVTNAHKVTDIDFSSLDLTDSDIFAKYMEGCAMKLIPNIVFDTTPREPEDYIPYSTQIGSLYCGGNVGSMILDGKTTIDLDKDIIIFDKLVGGCNNANVPAHPGLNARYEGGFLTPGSSGPTPESEITDKLELNLSNLSIQPKRWKGTKDGEGNYTSYELDANGNRQFEWNTIYASTGADTPPITSGSGTSNTQDLDRRFKGGNIYGGCYTSGHIDGNVIININGTILNRWDIFDKTEENDGEPVISENNTYNILERHSGVLLHEQGMDVLAMALNLFGGGYGKDTEIWGNVTINMNKGYVFQIYGGSEEGAIGKGVWNAEKGKYDYTGAIYDPRFSTLINLNGPIVGTARSASETKEQAEAEFIYGGGFEGPVLGDTRIYLGNGRVFNTFAGANNADIWGHTETYVGLNAAGQAGFPYVRDHIYGGNDLGGEIKGSQDFSDKIRTEMTGMTTKIHGYDGESGKSLVTTAAAYIQYGRGHVKSIFGGCYGDYDYKDRFFEKYTYANGWSKPGFTKPRLGNAFINFRPDIYTANSVERIYGAGQGHFRGIGLDSLQNSSYVLIDIPQTIETEHTYENMDIFGAGSYCGMGMGTAPATVAASPDRYSAIIDLFRGNVHDVYGGSFQEGFTRRTVVNVPDISTINVNNLFGGAYGSDPLYPCDVYEAKVNYHSPTGRVRNNIYGGNNHADRTLYGQVNITAPVWQNEAKGYLASVYGAGYGRDSWSQYTEVNLENGARVYEVYGGGNNGMVLNKKSLDKWAADEPSLDLSMPGYTENGLDNSLVIATALGGKYNTNVHIKEGATVVNYAYGGGRGAEADVSGTSYIDLLGGSVIKDLYAAGTSGSVEDHFGSKDFTASATAYILGGTARNVYGGGWEGNVGRHSGNIDDPYDEDILGETHVIIGRQDDETPKTFLNGLPAIKRNAYGGGEGGAVFGASNLTIYDGYIGYEYMGDDVPHEINTYDDYGAKSGTTTVGGPYYMEKIHDETWTDHIGENRLYDSGCVFGGGYIDNSSVDYTHVTLYGGHVRNSVFGGGEIAAIGRGKVNASRVLQDIYKAGSTSVKMYNGQVGRDIFGGGRGYNNLGERGTLYSDGFVFGKTEVDIHGGEIGTDEGIAQGYGNVFGGGDIGYVYSAYEYEEGGTIKQARGKKAGTRYDNANEGYYYEAKYNEASSEPDKYDFVLDGTEKIMTEDCKVLIEPQCLVKENITINGTAYAAGSYVPIDGLNKLGNKNDATWSKLDDKGIVIHNAVFAGGNTSSGSDQVYANATTVFGNATASIHDVYHRDLISVGTGHTGGLYGDGNLTFVDGYRGLNITNYGTDYYSINTEVTLEEYKRLSARERAYYELRYRCKKQCVDSEGKTYTVGSTITNDELITLFKNWTYNGDKILLDNGKPNSDYWEENGVMSRYAGRPMNTIQRSDFCGVFGSRMVMQGAQDRVPEIVDYTNYTINRVREVSLNLKKSVIEADREKDDDGTFKKPKKAEHGNYFGIYNIVNYLGALTSDVDFGNDDNTEGSVRTSRNADKSKYGPDHEGQTFYDWKRQHVRDQKRNNGNSHNQVALASGVYLELTSEKSTGNDLYEKDWGLITGVIELDLINVQPGIGGGFIYARNEHGVRSRTNKHHVTLTKLNAGAVTSEDFTYTTNDATKKEWQTSGNFVHAEQIIIDDCYNISGKYKTNYREPDGVPAHYWYIKGNIYIYDQYISAYTGTSNAYSESVNIPLIITAVSHGTMKLLNVQPNKYAYYAANNDEDTQTTLDDGRKLSINDVTYEQNSPISYWNWYLLSSSEKRLFVNKTYVVTANCTIGGVDYQKGKVLTQEQYDELSTSGAGNTKPNVTWKQIINGVEHNVAVDFDKVVHSSNNCGHDSGYILTYEVNNPSEWSKWYTPKTGAPADKITADEWKLKDASTRNTFEDGPTYRLADGIDSGIFGQREYKVGNIITKAVYDDYKDIEEYHPETIPTDPEHEQAEFERAYIVTKELENITTKNGAYQHLYPGAAVAQSDYTASQWSEMAGSVAPAYVTTSTIQLESTEYIYTNTLMDNARKVELKTNYPDLSTDFDDAIVEAYTCTKAGHYGGKYYESGINYRAMEVFCSMSKEDRANFEFNYDALDLFVDDTYSGIIGSKYQYDSKTHNLTGAENNKAKYSLAQHVAYTATYEGRHEGDEEPITYTDQHGKEHTINVGDELNRVAYESIPNEQHHYAPFRVGEVGKFIEGSYHVYVANNTFQIGDTPYASGQTLTSEAYNAMSTDDKKNVTELVFPESDAENTFYFCREAYQIGHSGEGSPVNSYAGVSGAVGGNYSGNGTTVPLGVVITKEGIGGYRSLVNKQTHFIIHGIAPIETSTLYVSRESDINDLSTEKIITVIYQYDYEESDADGMNIVPVSERHVVNIHLQFKSGIPNVEDISAPKIVLPGTSISVRTPAVTPGAYEVTGGGWEIFKNISDAESHTNGLDYTPTRDPLYWYEDGYYMAYYALTYLGKTYSNHVPLSVANYHDLADVMSDKTHHYFIDHEDVKREPKIYINDYSDSGLNGIDLFKNLVDLCHVVNNDPVTGKPTAITAEGALKGHMPLELDYVLHPERTMRGASYLEFFLRSDQDHTGSPWSPVASADGECFSGVLHGDGHTIKGLDHSLFDKLCGDVYNLGVTGSFTGAGIAETGEGYLENCWISTTGTPDKVNGENHFALFGDPSREPGHPKGTVQLVNCYYPVSNDYQTPSIDSHGKPIQMSDQSFYNGEVAYNLNGFYLNKRFYDSGSAAATTALGATPDDYQFYRLNANGNVPTNPVTGITVTTTGHYPTSLAATIGDLGYVERRFKDGDFIYAGGTIPETPNERLHEDGDGLSYYPIWPDDYLFFGQMLTYGYDNNRSHQKLPANINKSAGRLLTATTSVNRVYRAPAYFRSATMGLAHYNSYAIFAAKSKDDLHTAYPNMTAIDFTGGNGDLAGGHGQGLINMASGAAAGTKQFYPPLLDNDGLTFFQNADLTNNLLAYIPEATDDPDDSASKTYAVVNTALGEPAYAEDNATYRSIAVQDDSHVHGHPVVLTGGSYKAEKDHLLIDKQDFNAPISYTFASGRRMWYQREPDLYVDLNKGWEGISLPFTAELVTTQDKGEITHFYEGSDKGHEYWLRTYDGIKTRNDVAHIDSARFVYPAAGSALKEFTNTFLWDYYYHRNVSRDRNADSYQTYYQDGHDYADYPYAEAGTPYIIGFPGRTYYEFDLSGTFQPLNTYRYPDVTVPRLDKQMITFVSEPAITIAVSDNETETRQVNADGYIFKPNYLGQELAAGTYMLKADGSSYEITDDATTAVPFRPYFVTAPSPARNSQKARQIVFGSIGGLDNDHDISDDLATSDGSIIIQARHHLIAVKSTVNHPISINIYNVSGMKIHSFTLQPGETIETETGAAGIFFVNKQKLVVN